MKIIAVVVTYNRLALLQRTIAALKAQTRPLVFTQDNVGGSGGFARGIREARQMGADRIWCMDDDVFPRPFCLERLLEAAATHPDAAILAPRRFMGNKIICHDFTRYNLTNPLASMYGGRLKKCPPTAPTYVAGTAFEGPLISRQVVDTVGLPNAELFIFCDDTDYCLRTHQAGMRLLYVPQAEMDKAEFFTDDTWAERETKKKWKRYYQVRNATYLSHHYGRNWAVRHLRGVIGVAGYIATAAFTAPFSKGWKWGDIPRLWRAYRDGIHERLGKM